MRSGAPIKGLYAITPEVGEDARLYTMVEQALRCGAALLQYRDKHADPRRMHTRARQLRALCARYGALFIVNDNLDLAANVRAHGVHLGRDDADLPAARALLGARAIIGVSCYDQLECAHQACQAGADYVAFGSVFASRVKPQAVQASLDLIRRARRELSVPIVAIGGIDLSNAASVLEAGAHALAIITALFEGDDVELRAKRFAELMGVVTYHPFTDENPIYEYSQSKPV